MTTTPNLPTASRPAGAARSDTAHRLGRGTRTLLLAGIVAGPLYVGVSLAQALTREGFDITRHAWSQLANGDLGWIQATNLKVTGLLVAAFAYGLHRALHDGPGHRWGPRLLGVFGVGVFTAGFFPADAALGFPPGTPADYQEMTALGTGHMLSASTGFLAAIASCFVLARRFRTNGRRRWAVASRLVGVLFVASLIGVGATGSVAGMFAFIISIIAIFTWIAALAVHTRQDRSRA